MKNNTENPRVLLACPVSDAKKYIIFKWIDHIKKLSYPVDILLIDNSTNEQFAKHLKQKNVAVLRRPPYKNEKTIKETIAACQNMIVHQVLKNGYDYWFSLECDVFPPLDVVEKLMQHNQHLAAGCYLIGFNRDTTLCLQELAGPDTHQKTFITKPKSGFMLVNGQLRRVFAPGLGCVLIRRDVFQMSNIRFRVEKSLNQVFSDTIFYADLFKEEWPVFLDTSIMCTHENSTWNINKL